MSANAKPRLTRAQAEGVLYKLPECEQREVFEKQAEVRIVDECARRDVDYQVLTICTVFVFS